MKIVATCPECGRVFESDDGKDRRDVMPPGMGIPEHESDGERCPGSNQAVLAQYADN
jgi:rubredoxin